MKTKKILALLLAMCMMFSLLSIQVFATEGEFDGKTVILHTNDVHGAISGYACLAALEDDFEAKGAEVILVDAGDYSQGTTYVSTTKGMDAVDMMNVTGYDIVTIGNHEFDYGYAQLMENMSKAEFQVVCADVTKDGKTIFDANTVYTTESGVKIGFFGLETPEAQTKANPALIQGLTFVAGDELYACAQAQADELDSKSDIVICLSHLGVDASSEPNTSYDLWENTTGIDFIIDGHSHTVMTEGENKEPIQSTGTAFANIGVIVIDDTTRAIEKNYLVPVTGESAKDETVAAAAQKIIDRVDTEYGAVFAKSEVELNGDKEPGNRTEETNLGDLITDAMMWVIKKDTGAVAVPEENIVAITNGGGIRAWIHAGDITKKDINTVLPFGNTVAVVYVTGAELLEALEASTYCTPVSLGGFPQTAGMDITVDTTKEYDANDTTYPSSTYYGPKTINRVTINSINGKAFDEKATYAVITNNFCAAGGDTYHAFASASAQFDTGLVLDEVVMDYITTELGGVVGQKYAEPQGRMTVILAEEEWDGKVTIGGTDYNVWFTKYGNTYTDCKATNFFDVLGFEWGDLVTVKFNGQELALPVIPTYSYVESGKPAIIVEKGEDGKPTGYVSLAINMGNFGSTYGLVDIVKNGDGTYTITAKEGVTFPVEVTFEMYEEGGYMAEYILHDLQRTNNREDYPNLSDEEFANFRQITTTGMGANLYRTSSPINPELARNEIADAAIEKAGVTVIVNLADDEATAKAYEGFEDTYYSRQNVKYLNLGVDFSDADFKAGLAEGLKFMAENPGVYAFHCTEGKDRAGFVAALLECLMGATCDEVVADYMVTYYNYYGVEKGTEKYDAIATSNIVKTLKSAFGVEDLTKADLAKEAAEYLSEIGMTDAEIAALKKNLAPTFTDISGHWAAAAINYCCEAGLMNGVGDNKFAPETALSRAMLVTILYRQDGTPAVTAGNVFTDVEDGTWYTEAVIWAAENGIVNGYGDGRFGPTDNITREQFAAILWRYAKLKGVDVSVGEDTNILSYDDALEISEWAVPAIQWTCGAGIMSGMTESTINPKNNATRAQAATILMRYIESTK